MPRRYSESNTVHVKFVALFLRPTVWPGGNTAPAGGGGGGAAPEFLDTVTLLDKGTTVMGQIKSGLRRGQNRLPIMTQTVLVCGGRDYQDRETRGRPRRSLREPCGA
jgi:hypothetical protein